MSSTDKKYSDFQWSFSTLGCPEMTLNEICALARNFDLQYTELRAIAERVDLPTLFTEQFGAPKALAEYLSSERVGVSCLDTSLKLVGNSIEDRLTFLKFLPWADGIGTKLLRVFDGGAVDAGLNDVAYGMACDTIEWWLDEKSKSGWQADIAIETHDCLVHTASLERISAKFPELTFIWDTHHTWKKSNDSIESSWNKLGGTTTSVHIKDSISEPSARHPFTYVNLGDGEFPLTETLDMLLEQNFEGFVCLEWERMWHPYLPELKEALARAKELNWF